MCPALPEVDAEESRRLHIMIWIGTLLDIDLNFGS